MDYSIFLLFWVIRWGHYHFELRLCTKALLRMTGEQARKFGLWNAGKRWRQVCLKQSIGALSSVVLRLLYVPRLCNLRRKNKLERNKTIDDPSVWPQTMENINNPKIQSYENPKMSKEWKITWQFPKKIWITKILKKLLLVLSRVV